MSRPLNVKTVVVPKGQNKYGSDVVRFTADYLASDLYDMCIGCYPPCHSDLNDVIVLDPPTPPPSRTTGVDGCPADLRKATDGISRISPSHGIIFDAVSSPLTAPVKPTQNDLATSLDTLVLTDGERVQRTYRRSEEGWWEV